MATVNTIVFRFDTAVFQYGLRQRIVDSDVHGMSGMLGGVKVFSYYVIDRLQMGMRLGTTKLFMSEHGSGHTMSLVYKRHEGDTEDIETMVNRAIEAWKNLRNNADAYLPDGKVTIAGWPR